MADRATILLPQTAFALRKMARGRDIQTARLAELEARIIVELRLFGPLTMTSLVEVLGNEKSQVSRTLQSLQAAGIIARDGLRLPITLSAMGAVLAQTIVANAQVDSARLVACLSGRDQAVLAGWLPKLWVRACSLLAEERDHQSKSVTPGFARVDHLLMQQTTSLDLLSLRVATLGTLLQRSLFLACKRLVGMATSETIVLTQIWERGPIDGNELARQIGRPKAQTGRTANNLIELGLVQRKRALASHDWIYAAVPSGSESCNVLESELNRRENMLLGDLNEQDRADRFGIFRAMYERARYLAGQHDEECNLSGAKQG